jgi:hypothetical protein
MWSVSEVAATLFSIRVGGLYRNRPITITATTEIKLAKDIAAGAVSVTSAPAVIGAH